MTHDQMAELAARLSEKSVRFRKHADFLLTIVPGDPINTVAANGLTADADDFDRAADLIEQMHAYARAALAQYGIVDRQEDAA